MASVSVRVIPFTNERFIEVTQAVKYVSGVVPQLDTVQIDSAVGGRFLDVAAELERFHTLVGIAKRASLDEEESRQIIHHIAREM